MNIDAVDEIQLMKEDKLQLHEDDYKLITFSEEMQEKYKNILTVCTDGSFVLRFS